MVLRSLLLLYAAATTLACLAMLPSAPSASLLYVTSYASTLTTLNLTTDATTGQSSLKTVATSKVCPEASWITLDYPNKTLYCLDEAPSTPNSNSTLFRFKTNTDGTVTLADQIPVPNGAVSAVLYGAGKGLAIASYGSGAVSTYNITTSPPTQLQSESFHLTKPGPVPDRQGSPHPHQAITDPTGQFLLVPDLGADLVRVYSINPKTLQLTKALDLVAAPGSGPRHGTFLKTGLRTFFYLIAELANTVTVYDVTYNKDSLGFNQLFVTGTNGDNPVPAGAAAGEILLSPDSKYLLLTSRHPPGQPPSPSDPLITFTINPESGELTYHSTSPAGGLTPRHFSLNKAGDRVAVGLQDSGRVVVFTRDVVTGVVGDEPVAWVEGLLHPLLSVEASKRTKARPGPSRQQETNSLPDT